MMTVVATLKIKDGKADEARSFFKELAAETLANEEGTLVYTAYFRRDDPNTMVVYEQYASDEAFAIHGQNLAAKAGAFGALLDGPPDIVMLDEI